MGISRPIPEIIADIDAFRPIDGEWRGLDELIAESLDHPDAPIAFPALLAVFERFPNEDGAGVFWSIVHGIEAFPGYEPFVLASVRRNPTDMTLAMVNRMLNAGDTQVSGISLASLLRSVANNAAYSNEVRSAASRFADRHSG